MLIRRAINIELYMILIKIWWWIYKRLADKKISVAILIIDSFSLLKTGFLGTIR